SRTPASPTATSSPTCASRGSCPLRPPAVSGKFSYEGRGGALRGSRVLHLGADTVGARALRWTQPLAALSPTLGGARFEQEDGRQDEAGCADDARREALRSKQPPKEHRNHRVHVRGRGDQGCRAALEQPGVSGERHDRAEDDQV